MRLRYSPTSPFVRKVMVVALETGVSERIERIPTTVAPTTPNEDVARENPLVKVPALTTSDDGLVLGHASPVICEYLDTLHSGAKLFPPPARRAGSRSGSRRWATACSRRRSLAAMNWCGPRSSWWQDWIDAQLRKVRGAIAALEMEVEAGDLGNGGDAITIGQIAIGCALGYLDFRYQSEEWRGRSRRLAQWYGPLRRAQIDAAHRAEGGLMIRRARQVR